MAMNCPNCGADNPEDAEFCQRCAHEVGPIHIQIEGQSEVPRPMKGKRTFVLVVEVTVIVAVLMILVVMFNPSTSPIASIRDSDGDGHADSKDAFPSDPAEWKDADLDGVGDNTDVFPNESTQWADWDYDGYGDNPLGINPDEFPDDHDEWRDNDSDGVGDNADFYDSGNGKIKISIDSYESDGTTGSWNSGNPHFVIQAYSSNNGSFHQSYTSGVFTDEYYLSSPFSVTIDIDDYTTAFSFSITVYDFGFENLVIDYSPESAYTGYIHMIYPPFSGSWFYNGSDDGLTEVDCILRYSVSVTA